MLELKLVYENKTKRAAVILIKTFNSNSVSFSEESSILHICVESQGVEVTNFLCNFQQLKKKLTGHK